MASRPFPFRFFALVWAVLQLASPGMSAVADGLATEAGANPAAHVEATTGKGCPVVHSPDCGMCRYLSQGARLQPVARIVLPQRASIAEPQVARFRPRHAATILPDGRAPPVL